MDNFILIAHRCGPSIYPEQSVASARHALSLGADMVEMDIQYTLDYVPVICHDPNTKRMFGEDCLVSNMDFNHFMTLRQQEDPSYPSHSLENIFASNISPILFHCKITGERLADLATRIVENDFEEKCVIGVQYPKDVDIIKDVSRKIKILAFMPSFDLLEGFLSSDAEYIRLWEDWFSPDMLDKVHSNGKKLWIMAGKPTLEGVGYTTEENLLYWKDSGCDGVLVNDIAWAQDVLSSK